MIYRDRLSDNAVRLWCDEDRCSFLFERLRDDVLLVTIEGYDRGRLGRAPLEEIERELRHQARVDLFFDIRRAVGATAEVSDAWTAWFATYQPRLRSVSILVGSKFMWMTVEVAKLFSRTGELIRVHTDPRAFENELRRLQPRYELRSV